MRFLFRLDLNLYAGAEFFFWNFVTEHGLRLGSRQNTITRDVCELGEELVASYSAFDVLLPPHH